LQKVWKETLIELHVMISLFVITISRLEGLYPRRNKKT
jgi:hypothetical protein